MLMTGGRGRSCPRVPGMSRPASASLRSFWTFFRGREVQERGQECVVSGHPVLLLRVSLGVHTAVQSKSECLLCAENPAGL